MKTALRFGIVYSLFLLACFVHPVRASVELDFLELNAGYSGFQLYNNGGTQTVNAGRMLWDLDGPDDANAPPLPLFDSAKPSGGDGADDLITFCIELGQVAAKNTIYTKTPVASAPDPYVSSTPVGAKIGAQRAGLLDLLADHFWDDAQVSDLNAAAFQLAVWEVVHESTSLSAGNPLPGGLLSAVLGLSSTEGTFYITNNPLSGNRLLAVNLANSWLDQLGSLLNDPNLSIFALTNPTKQDQIYQYVDIDTNQVVPEPISLVVWLGVGLAGIGMVKLRDRLAS